MSIVNTTIEGSLGVITVDNPPVNALSHAVREGISRELKSASNDDQIKAIVIICNGRTFCAGADISEFGKPPVSPTLPELMTEMDNVDKPMVAAMHGTALGGGFEVALCCHYRILDENAKVGLPEVNLGLIPGAGGTQRLPRLIGATAALDMICGGKSITAVKAFDLGVADKLSEDNLLEDAKEFANNLIKENKPVRRISDLHVDADDAFFTDYETKIARRSRGFLAPFAAIETVKVAVKNDFEEGIDFEREKFKELVTSSHSKAQRHLFFAERAANKIDGIDKQTLIRDVKRIAVIGGGLMGCGIAINFLNRGLPVTLLDISSEAAEAAKERIAKIYGGMEKKGRMSADKVHLALDLLTVTDDYNDLRGIDLIIEAVFEDIEIKKQVFEKLEAVNPQAILATNTSFLDIDEIASILTHPENMIGLHFFSPAHIMPLLEIVRTEKSDPSVIATALKIAKIIGKTPVVSGVCYGFIANRMSSCYGREAGLLLLEGATVDQVDQVMFEFGMPMGMFSMLDMAGIDIGVGARSKLDKSDYDERAFSVHAALVENGQLGQKSGAGFYTYDGDKSPNPNLEKLAIQMAEKHGIERRDVSNKEIEERCIFALVNEGYKIVEEGIAQRTSDVDVVYSFGFGFPRYKGGPLHYAEHIGLKYIIERMNEFAKTQGPRWWTPSKLLLKMAEKGSD